MHYLRKWRTGDVNTVRIGHRYTEIDPAKRLRERSRRQGDCIVYEFSRPSRSGHRLMGFRGKPVGVHRIAWILAHGEIPDGLSVLHRCDVPNCINPEHLFLGTVADNNADRDQKGRHIALRGSKNGGAKLSEYQVIEIRELLAQGLSQREIAARYRVNQFAIWRIASGEGWRHVTGAPVPKRRDPGRVKAVRKLIPLSERPHGSYVTYCKGCRCDPCTVANTEYGRERRAIREKRRGA